MKLIELESLPDNFRIGLGTAFRKELFNICITKIGINNLTKELKYARKTVENLRRGYVSGGINKKKRRRFLKVKTLKKLAQIAGISLEEIESHIIETNSISLSLKIKLPMYASKELASIVGHCFGDGYVSNRYFGYYNSCKKLINEIQTNVKFVFGLEGKVIIRDDGTYMIYYPGIIGKLLELIGAPKGNKVKNVLKIPKWINNGTEDVKIAFLRALFDDEGSVKFSGYDRSIQFRLSKCKDLRILHREFVQEIQELLLNLGVETTNICEFERKKVGRYGKTICMGINIHGQKNLKIFLEKISLIHPEKVKKLTSSIKNYKQVQYRKNEIEKLILNELKINPKNIFSLAKKLKRDSEYVNLRLYKLRKDDLVERVGNSVNDLWKVKS